MKPIASILNFEKIKDQETAHSSQLTAHSWLNRIELNVLE